VIKEINVAFKIYKIMKFLIIGMGIFSAFCAIQNYDWFFKATYSSLFVRIFGRVFTR
jgi:hypothetical protein